MKSYIKHKEESIEELKEGFAKLDQLMSESYGEVEVLDEALIMFGKSAYPRSGHVVILAGGAACFDGNTLVKTDKGKIPISEIKIGDMVQTFNETTNEIEFKKVSNNPSYNDHPENILELTFENGEKVICTESHEFYVDGAWVKAKDL